MPSTLEANFIRPVFQVSTEPDTDPTAIHSLPDLIEFNSEHNGSHIFAVQEIRRDGKHEKLIEITFGELQRAATGCAQIIRETLPGAQDQKPVALCLESDINLFVHLAALLYLNIPVLVLSIRLSPVAVSHLMKSTSANAIIVSQKCRAVVEDAMHLLVDDHRSSIQMLSSVPLEQSLLPLKHTQPPFSRHRPLSSDQEKVIILHSSGTTGLPKPIPLAHRYLLGYAACHRLQPDQCRNKLNISTLPMYHGFGLLGPCISLAIGKTCCFPSASVIPSGGFIADLIEITQASSLMTVPSILDEVKSNPRFLRAMERLDFVAVGGGAIKPAIGELLVSNGIRLLNHYGATEIGAIAPIFIPTEDYDWHYLRIRTDMGLELKETGESDDDGNPYYQLMGYPFGWGRPFVIQDLLRRRAGSTHTEVAILGRNDDLLVLSTGEKVLPNQFESILSRQPGVKTAIVFGQDREEIGVLIEPDAPLPEQDIDALVERIWSTIQLENKSLDRHARVASKSMILIKSAEKALPRSDKGSIMRRQVYDIFQQEIERVYASSESHRPGSFALGHDYEQLVKDLRVLVGMSVRDRGLPAHQWTDSDDWFVMGMDSLEATRLARSLNSVSNKESFPIFTREEARPSLIYQHPSFQALSRAILTNTQQKASDSAQKNSTASHMLHLVAKYTRDVSPGCTVLLTGATGHLGVHLLEQLTRMKNVSSVICLSRSHSGQDAKSRQQLANDSRGVVLSEPACSKVSYLSSNQLHATNLGLSYDEYRLLLGKVTHVVHNAWPMDFQMTLSSFEPQIQTLRRLVDLCIQSRQVQGGSHVPRLLFTSSIAVGAHYSGGGKLPEAPISDPLTPAHMGYAQAKWVCEQILDNVAQSHKTLVSPCIVRLGQLTGGSFSGVWNTHEHFPAILKASQHIGALPALDGTFSWIPIDAAARSVVDILFSESSPTNNIVYHVENPIRQAWKPLLPVLASKLKIGSPSLLPIDAWLQRVSSMAEFTKDSEFLVHLLPFLQEEFEGLSSGGLVLDTARAREVSRSLRLCNGVGLNLLTLYLENWQKQGFLE